jgi:hypothetical protein
LKNLITAISDAQISNFFVKKPQQEVKKARFLGAVRTDHPTFPLVANSQALCLLYKEKK